MKKMELNRMQADRARSRSVGLMVAGLATIAGCGTLQTHHVLTGPPGPPRGDVRVVLQGQPVPADMQEVAIVQAVGTGPYARLENVIGGLTAEAGQLGCSAVVNVKIDQGSTTASGTGTCVRELGVAGTPPPAPR
jgi:hypothetical protein